MNYILNDYGVSVVAVGAPGSVERIKTERPKLIGRLNALYYQAYESYGKAVDEAVEMIRAEGITSSLETRLLLNVSRYGDEPAGSVTDYALRV